MADDETAGWRDKVDRFSVWRSELTDEAAMLPQTLADLRMTIQDLRKISARLETATMGLEAVVKVAQATGIAPAARQLDAVATEMESQMRTITENVTGGDLVGKAVSDLQKTFDAFAALIPQQSDGSAGSETQPPDV
jgi:phage-related protein